MGRRSYGYNRVKTGLGLVCLSLVISMIMALVLMICYAINKTPTTLVKINAIIIIIAKVIGLFGILICLFSGQKQFRLALIIYSVIIILLIIFAVLNKDFGDWIYGLFYGLLACAHLSIIMALKTTSASRKNFNTTIISICLVLFAAMIVFVILASLSVIKGNWVVIVIKVLDMLESFFFLMAIFTTYRALR